MLCPSTAGSSPPPQSYNFLCPLLFLFMLFPDALSSQQTSKYKKKKNLTTISQCRNLPKRKGALEIRSLLLLVLVLLSLGMLNWNLDTCWVTYTPGPISSSHFLGTGMPVVCSVSRTREWTCDGTSYAYGRSLLN